MVKYYYKGIQNIFMMITKRLRMEGFICNDWL
jgi:hypothetical protein